MVFVTCGMEAVQYQCHTSCSTYRKEQGALTVGVVTKPFRLNQKHVNNALAGIEKN